MTTHKLLQEARRHLERLRKLQALGDPDVAVELEREGWRRGPSLLRASPDKLPASARVRSVLRGLGWVLQDVLDRSVQQVLRQPSIGRKTIRFLTSLLFAHGHRWGRAETQSTIRMPDPDAAKPWNGWTLDVRGSILVPTKPLPTIRERRDYLNAFYRAYGMSNPGQ